MKKIKLILSFVICLLAMNAAIAQSPAKDHVRALDKQVNLSADQEVKVEAAYDAYYTKTEGMTDSAEMKAAKVELKNNIAALLTEAQRAKMNTRLRGNN